MSNRRQVTDQPVTTLPGVGPGTQKKLSKMGIGCVLDLLLHLPLRYEDRTRIHPLGTVQPGNRVLIEAEVVHAAITYGRRRSLVVAVADGTGQLTLRFFYFHRKQQQSFARGKTVRCFGEVRVGYKGLEMVHPEWKIQAPNQALAQTLTPVYPTTEGLGQKSIRRMIGGALDQIDQASLVDPLPPDVVEQLALPSVKEALRVVHHPTVNEPQALLAAGLHPGQRRLALEELIAHRLSLRLRRSAIRAQRGTALPENSDLCQRFLQQLPFTLTSAQARVVDEIKHDLAHTTPMLRLVQGDVGSGKTVVAAASVLLAVDNQRQAAVTAPTELLAEQHFRSFSDWLEPLGVKLVWLSGKVQGKNREKALADIAGDAQIIIGTHALMQEQVRYRDLALIVVDEQHRFGVHQRLALRDKGTAGGLTPHQLTMTATPIPRTLAMTSYADLDVSIIDELPPGRQAIKTIAVNNKRRDEVIERVALACEQGKQAYWVCTLIEESEALEAEAATDIAQALTEALPKREVGLIHGRLKPAEKQTVMGQFKDHKLDLLVATTVIEVGVDVPNATLIIIENAERLGLSQLHQLRGRVGRGEEASSCVLMYEGPLSDMAKQRIAVLRDSNDGFRIAERDLELRGPGEVLGTRQTGALTFRIADLQRDLDLLEVATEVCAELESQSQFAAEQFIDRWVGGRAEFADV